MINVYKSRLVPSDRKYSVGDKSGTQQVNAYDAPLAGLSSASPQAGRSKGTALVMDNVIPTTSGCKARPGYTELASTTLASGEKLNRLFTYTGLNDSKVVFAATDTTVSQISPGYGSTLTTAFTGQNNSNYSTVEMQTASGKFMTIVNGYDSPRYFDGTSWTILTQYTGSNPIGASEIQGVNPDVWSFGWTYANREYFIQKNTFDVWYLGQNSFSGVAAKVPLKSVFKNSTSLLFGGTFSYDSGAGIDDFIVFVTKEGEVALYQGIDPSTLSAWTFKGLFKMAPPLGADSHFNVAGDLIVATQDGLTPLSAIFKKDVTELKIHSLSRAIDKDLADERKLIPTTNTSWRLVKSDFHNLAFLKVPRRGQAETFIYVVNMETGSWCRFTNFLVEDIAVAGDSVYFCNTNKVFEAMKTGQDDGQIILCRIVTDFDDFGADGRTKKIHRVKSNFITRNDLKVNLSVETDYNISNAVYPDASTSLMEGVATYGDPNTIWDDANTTWAGTPGIRPHTETRVFVKRCNSAALQVTFASDSVTPLDVELTSMSVAYTQGTHF